MSKTLQTVEEIATEKYPETDSFTLIRRRCFIEGYQSANQAAQGYKDALERIVELCKYDKYLLISDIAQQALSAAPTTQEETYGEFMRSNPPIPPTTPIKVLDEKLQIASDAWNACRDRSDYENRKAWFDFKKLPTPMTKIEYIDSLSQSLKPQP